MTEDLKNEHEIIKEEVKLEGDGEISQIQPDRMPSVLQSENMFMQQMRQEPSALSNPKHIFMQNSEDDPISQSMNPAELDATQTGIQHKKIEIPMT